MRKIAFLVFSLVPIFSYANSISFMEGDVYVREWRCEGKTGSIGWRYENTPEYAKITITPWKGTRGAIGQKYDRYIVKEKDVPFGDTMYWIERIANQ